MANWAADFLDRESVGEVVKRHTHSIHTRQSNGEIRADFTGAPCHFLDTDGIYKPIDTKLVAIGAEHGAPGLMSRIKKSREVNSNGHSQKTDRVGVYNYTKKTFTHTTAFTGDGLVSEDKIITEKSVYQHVITLTETGLREELVLHSDPNIGTLSDDYVCMESTVSEDFPDGELGEYTSAGYTFPLPHAWDAAGSQAPTKRFASKQGNRQMVYTGVPAAWLSTATYPVTIDPDYAGGASYGHIYGTAGGGNTMYIARATSSGSATNVTWVGLRTQYSEPFYDSYTWRSYLNFDTSAITDTYVVTQANLKLVCTNDYSDAYDPDIVIRKQDWSSQNPIAAGNREAAYDGCLAATSDDNIWRNTLGMSLNTQYTSGNLSTSWINKAGLTYYSLLSSNDRDGNDPTVTGSNAYIILATPSNTTPAYRPVLTVLYSPNSPSNSPSISPSTSNSPSNSPSVSPSPSPASYGKTRGNYAVLPTTDADLETPYSAQDSTDISSKNDIRVGQSGILQYMIHEFKNYVNRSSCSLECEIQTDLPPSASTVYLQIYNQTTNLWETIDSDSTSPASTDFVLSATVADTANYIDGTSFISCRVYQLAI
jgi:hypothetical protein